MNGGVKWQGGLEIMYLPIENVAFCLNCTNEWPVVLEPKELAFVCPRCGWRLGILRDLILLGLWTTRERGVDESDRGADEKERPS